MTYIFSDFEDQPTGSVPAGWTVEAQDGTIDPVVTESDPIEGSKSFKVADDVSGGATRVSHPVGDETIQLRMEYHADRSLAGENRSPMVNIYSDSGFLYGYAFVNGGNTADEALSVIYMPDSIFSETELGNATPVASLNRFQDYDIEIRNPATDLALLIDGTVQHDPSDTYSGASAIHLKADDCVMYYDGYPGGGGGGGELIAPGATVVLLKDDLAHA